VAKPPPVSFTLPHPSLVQAFGVLSLLGQQVGTWWRRFRGRERWWSLPTRGKPFL